MSLPHFGGQKEDMETEELFRTSKITGIFRKPTGGMLHGQITDKPTKKEEKS